MYIPDFWVGVIATVLVELMIIIIVMIVATYNKGDKDESDVD